jgi:hypothetical protein
MKAKGRILYIPLKDFMKMQCDTAESLVCALNSCMRLSGIQIYKEDDVLNISIFKSSNVVTIESYSEVPF